MPLFGRLPGVHPVVFTAGPSPCADRKLLAGMPNEDYYLFWSHDKALFRPPARVEAAPIPFTPN